MRGGRRAVIALVWLLGTGAATAITIEGVRVVGSNIVSSEGAISPLEANAALNARTTTTSVALTTAAPATTSTEAPTTASEVPTTEAPTTEVPPSDAAPVTPGKSTTTTHQKASSPATTAKVTAPAPQTSAAATTAPATAAPAPPSTSPPTNPPTTPAPPPATTSPPTTQPAPSCIQETKQTQAGFVAVCFSPTKLTVLAAVARQGWTSKVVSTGTQVTVTFRQGDKTVTVLAYWSGGPQWVVTSSG